MSVTTALLEFGIKLAEAGATGDVEVRLPRDAWAQLNFEVASASRFMAPSGSLGGASIALHSITGRIDVRPVDPRDSVCPHRVPWDYCNECQRRNG